MSNEQLYKQAANELAACLDNGENAQHAANRLFYEEHRFDAIFTGLNADEEWEMVNDLILAAMAKLEAEAKYDYA